MYWENPTVLLALWILPAVAGLLVYAHGKRIAAASKFVDAAMVRRLMPPLRSGRPWLKGTILLIALALLVVAAARPRFGVFYERVSQRGVDLFVLLDVSRSMTAQDVAPSRLERAKSDIRDLLSRLAGDRVGLIVFAGRPAVRVPLTTDHAFFQTVLEEIDVHSAPRGGSLIGDAIRKAIEAMPERHDRDQVLVLITDGDDQESFPLDAARQAAERGIKIFTVGLGDAREGARVPMPDESGSPQYLTYQGQVVWSKLNESLLREIAMTSGGAYIPAGTRAYDLGQIYEDHLARLAQGEIQVEKRKRYREQFQVFACLGLVLLLIEMAIPDYPRAGVTGRPKEEVA
jgi:Ca-activated chloride channel family protein